MGFAKLKALLAGKRTDRQWEDVDLGYIRTSTEHVIYVRSTYNPASGASVIYVPREPASNDRTWEPLVPDR